MRRFSPAKLNLFLHITGRRADGYHNLQSVFCLIDFGDFLTFELATPTSPLLTLTGADGLTDEVSDNLIYKAVQALADHYPAHVHPLTIHLEKHLPTGAGLGGGSSNCATTLLAINELWKLDLSTDELIAIGATLGADVPFFIFAHTHQTSAIVEGIGERLYPIVVPACEFLLLIPNAHISTAQFFSENELKRDCHSYTHDVLRTMNFCQLTSEFGNVFEPLACKFSPKVAQALSYLRAQEHLTKTTARMTGTGSVVFLPLNHIDDDTKTTLMNNAPCPALITRRI